MLDALTVLASTAPGEEEPSKALFYIAGGLLASFAVMLSVIGLTREDWPSKAGERGIIGVTTVLVAFTMASIIITA